VVGIVLATAEDALLIRQMLAVRRIGDAGGRLRTDFVIGSVIRRIVGFHPAR
jgi:hypothetical protein